MFLEYFVHVILINVIVTNCLRNLNNCKVTRDGSEYRGPHSRTKSGALCDMWIKVPEAQRFHDLSFPDGSKVLAKNDCRNPKRNDSGPWCYAQGIAEFCEIPLCRIEECRLTGPGLEYNGTIRQSAWFHGCLPWDTTEHQFCGNITDNSTVCNMCRNPDDSNEGPWCWVHGTGSEPEKELCDVPLCTNADPVTLINDETGIFNQFFALKSPFFLAKFQLWDAKDWAEGRLAILLTVTDQLMDTAKLKEWGSGIALVFGNKGAFLTTPEGQDKIKRPSILSGTNSTNVTITWSRTEENHLTVSVLFNGEDIPALVVEFDTDGLLLDEEDFKYVSFIGNPAIVELVPIDSDCSVITTAGGNPGAWWQLERVLGHNEFNFSLRLSKDATLILSPSPTAKQQIAVTFTENGRVFVQVVNGSERRTVTEGQMGIWSFWDWHGIKIEFWIDHMTVSSIEETGNREILYKKGFPEVAGAMWVAPKSQSVAHWMMHCRHPVTDTTSKHAPPECVSSPSELFYNGTHNVADGHHCVPWIDKRIPVKYQKDSLYDEFGSKISSMNYCRNLDLKQNGPFCFIHSSKYEVTKTFCRIPLCRQTVCKLSGIGFEYTGDVTVTRSNRTCLANGDKDGAIYCRNPSRSIGGPWCHTSDPNLSKDYCNIPDCQLPGGSIILVTKPETQRLFYISPSWKKHGFNFWLKCWDPEKESSLIITLWPRERDVHYKLFLGGGSAEKVKLSFVSGEIETSLIEITSAHLVPSGFWRGLWLRVGPGIVQLGREHVHYAFIDWEASTSEDTLRLDPLYIDFTTESGNWVGVGFKMDACLVEKVSGAADHRLWPIGIWRDGSTNLLNMSVHASGEFAVHLFSEPGADEYYSLEVKGGRNFTLMHVTPGSIKIVHSTFSEDNLMDPEKWTTLLISYGEAFLALELAGVVVLDFYDFTRPLIIYWFSVVSKTGELSWAANCEPLDMGEEPRDGGWSNWSPWECSVTCGGGEGQIQRTCDNPPPNILGRECTGSGTYEGACNDFLCGDVPPDLRKKVRQRLSEAAISLTAKRGESTKIGCNRDLAQAISAAVSNVTFEWSLNGFPWISNRNTDDQFDLDLYDVSTDHSGVYVCRAIWEDDEMVLAVASLIVTAEMPTASVRETSFLQLQCHGSALSHIFADLSQRWEIDGLTWKNYGPTFLDAVDLETVTDITKYLQGEWICIVSQEDLGLEWKTNWLLLQVKPPPSFWTHLIEDRATAPFFGFVGEKYVKIYFIFLMTILLLIISGVSIVCCFV